MKEHPEEGTGTSSGCAGAAVIAAAVLGAVLGLYAVSRTVFILTVWVIGWGSVIWIAKHTPKSVQDAAKPAPPAPSERGSKKEPQVRMIRDTGHPNRWAVAAPSPWMGVEIDKEAGTT